MAKSALRLDTRRPLADGTYPVQIRVGYGTNIYLPTNIYLLQPNWDARTQCAIGQGAKAINNILGRSLLRITNRIYELRESGRFDTYTRAQLRQMLLDTSLAEPTVDIPSLEKYVDEIMKQKAGSTRKRYGVLKKKLLSYCNPSEVKLPDMDAHWWNGFIALMDEQGIKRTSAALYLSQLKHIIRYAEDSGAAVNRYYTKVNSRISTDTKMRNLPVERMREIRDAELREKAAMCRDAFLLSFYLIGINVADMLTLPKDSVKDGRLYYRRKKTGKAYNIKIEPEALRLIEKYRGKELLLNFGEIGENFQQRCNHYLTKKFGITWYYARYSWANYAVDLDIPKDTISEALGHKHGSPITGIYIRYERDKVDKANRMVIDHLNG